MIDAEMIDVEVAAEPRRMRRVSRALALREGFMRSCILAAALGAVLLLIPAAALQAEDTVLGETHNGNVDETWKVVLPYDEVEGVLGQQVTSNTGEKIGRIVQVLVDRTGRVQAAVIDFGGFLGVGSRKVVVDWAALHFSPGGSRTVTVDLTPDQVKAAPEYKAGKPVVVLGALQAPAPEL